LFVIIGFARTSYSVIESVGTLQVDIEVFYPYGHPFPPTGIHMHVGVFVETISGTASKCIESTVLLMLDAVCYIIL
jgi:hypothetical protein